MFSVNFEKPLTNSYINSLVEHINKKGMDEALYKDIAFIFTCDTTKVTQRFLVKLAKKFVEFSKNPILVVELRDILEKDEEALHTYGSYFKDTPGVTEMFGIECIKEFDLEYYTRNKTESKRPKRDKTYEKKSKRNNLKHKALKDAQHLHREKMDTKRKKKQEFEKTEKLIKKYSTLQ